MIGGWLSVSLKETNARNTDKIIRKTEENAVLLERTKTAKSVHWYFFVFFCLKQVSHSDVCIKIIALPVWTKKKSECFKVELNNPNWRSFPPLNAMPKKTPNIWPKLNVEIVPKHENECSICPVGKILFSVVPSSDCVWDWNKSTEPQFFKSFVDANKREEVERMNLTIYQVCKVERLSYCYCRHVVRRVTGVRKRKD